GAIRLAFVAGGSDQVIAEFNTAMAGVEERARQAADRIDAMVADTIRRVSHRLAHLADVLPPQVTAALNLVASTPVTPGAAGRRSPALSPPGGQRRAGGVAAERVARDRSTVIFGLGNTRTIDRVLGALPPDLHDRYVRDIERLGQRAA